MTPEERTQKAIEWSQTTTATAWLIERWLWLTGDNLEVVELAIKSHIPGLLHGDTVIMLWLREQVERKQAKITP